MVANKNKKYKKGRLTFFDFAEQTTDVMQLNNSSPAFENPVMTKTAQLGTDCL